MLEGAPGKPGKPRDDDGRVRARFIGTLRFLRRLILRLAASRSEIRAENAPRSSGHVMTTSSFCREPLRYLCLSGKRKIGEERDCSEIIATAKRRGDQLFRSPYFSQAKRAEFAGVISMLDESIGREFGVQSERCGKPRDGNLATGNNNAYFTLSCVCSPSRIDSIAASVGEFNQKAGASGELALLRYSDTAFSNPSSRLPAGYPRTRVKGKKLSPTPDPTQFHAGHRPARLRIRIR